MNFFKPKPNNESSPSPQSPTLALQQALTHIQTQCSTFLHHHHRRQKPFNLPFLNPNPTPLKTHLDSALSDLHRRTKQAIEAGFSVLAGKNPATAAGRRRGGDGGALAVDERLTGVHVYALGNASEEFVLVSGLSTGKSIGLFCFEERDAEALLDEMKSMDPTMRSGSRVVAVPLNKVCCDLCGSIRTGKCFNFSRNSNPLMLWCATFWINMVFSVLVECVSFCQVVEW